MTIYIDTETTGVGHDARIVELAILSGDAVHSWRFQPGIPIPAEATAIHGITDADVVDCATFAEQAADVLAHISGDDTIAGYNVKFDLQMIQSELSRAGLPLLDLSSKRLVCALQYWRHHEPRTLTAAVEKFLGRPHTGAHGAAADVRATRDVFEAMRLKFGGEIEAADPWPERHQYAGPTNHMLWRDDVVVWGVGKHKGTPLHETPRDYLRWACEADFPEHVKRACRAAAEYPPDLFLSRCKWHFGREAM